MPHKLLTGLLCAVLLSGCAANVQRGGSAPLNIPEAAKQNLALTFKGNSKVEANEDWAQLRHTWTQALDSKASAAGYKLHDTEVTPGTSTASGVLVLVNVSNFRYLSTGARVGAGVMTGNAWVNSSVDYIDLSSGKALGSRTYNTSSSAWEGIMSAMTDKQVEAIAEEIIADIKSAKAN